MKSFHSDDKIKAKYIARVDAHIKADNLVRGIGWKGGRGCAVGCTLENYNHAQYEVELGIPKWLAHVEDTLFEGMNLEKSKTWPQRFLEAIPVGVDLEPVKGKFLIIVLNSALESFDHKKFPKVKESIDRVISLWESGGSSKEFSAAARAAYAAYAADAAADADADAAYAAARAADAAYAAADAAAYAAARAAAYADAKYDYFADELLKLLREVK